MNTQYMIALIHRLFATAEAINLPQSC